MGYVDNLLEILGFARHNIFTGTSAFSIISVDLADMTDPHFSGALAVSRSFFDGAVRTYNLLAEVAQRHGAGRGLNLLVAARTELRLRASHYLLLY